MPAAAISPDTPDSPGSELSAASAADSLPDPPEAVAAAEPRDPLAPVAAIDPVRLAAGIAARTGTRLELLGRAAGGEVGAAYVRMPDGSDGVLTGIGSDARSAQDVRLTADVLDLARATGLPVPAYRLVVDLGNTVAIVQERLPGRVPEHRTRALADAMVRLNDGFAGLLAGRADVPAPELYLERSGPGFCVHEALEAYGPRSRRLLAWVREVGATAAREGRLDDFGDDLMHLDFHPGNVLVDPSPGAANVPISGVIDWDGMARGDRHFALVTLRFDARPAGFDTATERWLDGLLDERLDPAALRLFWAHMSLRQVDWVIRHYSPSAVEDRLDVAETRMK